MDHVVEYIECSGYTDILNAVGVLIGIERYIDRTYRVAADFGIGTRSTIFAPDQKAIRHVAGDTVANDGHGVGGHTTVLSAGVSAIESASGDNIRACYCIRRAKNDFEIIACGAGVTPTVEITIADGDAAGSGNVDVGDVCPTDRCGPIKIRHLNIVECDVRPPNAIVFPLGLEVPPKLKIGRAQELPVYHV